METFDYKKAIELNPCNDERTKERATELGSSYVLFVCEALAEAVTLPQSIQDLLLKSFLAGFSCGIEHKATYKKIYDS